MIVPLISEVSGQVVIKGQVTDPNEQPMFGVIVHVDGVSESTTTNADGNYKISGLSAGPKKVTFFQPGFKKVERTIDPKNGVHRLDIQLELLSQDLAGVTVRGEKESGAVMTTLRPVEGTAIYASKKTEVINLDNITANLASNRARQVFSQVAGLNIWESD